MKTSTMFFIGVMVAILLAGIYFIVKSNKQTIYTAPAGGSTQPTANLWSTITGIVGMFGQGSGGSSDPKKGKIPNGYMGRDISGQLVDRNGFLADKDGNYVNEEGILLDSLPMNIQPDEPITYIQLV